MKIRLLLLLSILIAVTGCSLFSKSEKLYSGQRLYSGHLPNIGLVIGAYLNSCSPDHDTLILANGFLFFLLTKDSSGKSQLLRGKWAESPPGETFEPGPAHFKLYPQGDSRFWIATLSIKEDSKYDVRIVIDTLRAFMRMTSQEMSTAWKDHWVDSGAGIRYNSIGKPYCFEKQLHADQ